MFKGTVFLFNNPKTRKIELTAVNQGASPGLLTHNVRATQDEALNKRGLPQHDDNGAFGHGNAVPSGTEDRPGIATLGFPVGGQYRTGDSDVPGQYHWRWHTVPIEAGAWFRVGFRSRAWAVVQAPAPGEYVEIPYEDMKPQTTSAMGVHGRFAGWDTEPAVRDGSHVPEQLKDLWTGKDPFVVQGQARIKPVATRENPGQLAGWEVWFDNTARGRPGKGQTHGFTATVTLVNAQGEGAKNAGLGLESMACPGGNHSAMQFIVANGDYGVNNFGIRANAGTEVRLGIRGHSSTELSLPSLAQGEVSCELRNFEKSNADTQNDWFDGDALLSKMGEKKGRVSFFRDGKSINHELPDTVYRGEEAFIRAEFKQPPRLLAHRVADSVDFPGGGWEIEVKNELPDADDLGPVGFPVSLKVAHGDLLLADASGVPPVELTPGRREARWFIPNGFNFAGVVLDAGSELVVDSGALGWRGRMTLPGSDESVDTSRDLDTLHATWELRETDYLRANLFPKMES